MRRLAKIFDHTDNDEGEFLVEEGNTAPTPLAIVPELKRRRLGRSYMASLPSAPSLVSVSPEYAALLRKQTEINIELAKITQDINDTMVGLSRAASEEAFMQKARVDAILDADPGDLSKVTEQKQVLGRRLSDLQQRAADLKAANAEVERRIITARNRASVLVCAQIEDQYREIVVAICDRLRDLHEASLAYQKFTDALTGEDIAWTRLGVMFPTLLGDPRDSQGRVSGYFREAARLGFITTNNIPETLR